MRHPRRLKPAEADRLRVVPFSYKEVGASARSYPSDYPTGYHLFQHREVVGRGQAQFEAAVHKLMSWRMHADAGLRVISSSAHVETDAVVRLQLGMPPFALRIPCRVVYVVSEPDRAGFGYGTLPGHPESGEEAFVVEIDPDGQVVFTVSAFSRPGTLLAKLAGPLAGPLSGFLQRRALRRYSTTLRKA